MVQDIWILKNGEIKLDRSILLFGRGYGEAEAIPVYSVLLKTSEGYVLIDTGMNPDGVSDPEATWGARAKLLVPDVKKEDDIRNRLDEINVKAREIKYVINTHMHWDHTGGNRFFGDAVFIVQKAEHRFAFCPDSSMGASYMKNHFDYPLGYRLIEGDCEICEGVYVLATPGHTPGHQSVAIRFENGNHLIVCGDAVYTYRNLEEAIPPGNCFDYQMAILSLYKIGTLRKLLNSEILPSHEPGGFYAGAEKAIQKLKG